MASSARARKRATLMASWGSEDVHQVVGHPRPLLGRGLVRPDVQAPVDHGGVGGDHLHGDLLPQAEGQKVLPLPVGPARTGIASTSLMLRACWSATTAWKP